MNRPGNLCVEIEVTTAASGDVGHQALVLPRSLETVPMGCGWLGGGPLNCLVGDCLRNAWFWYNLF